MANTFLNTARSTGMATSNVQANIDQTNNQVGQPVQNNVNGTTGVQQTSQPQSNQINPITIPIQIQPQIAQTGQTQNSTNENVQPNSNLQVADAQQSQTYNAPTPQAYNGNTQSSNVVDFNQIYQNYNQTMGNTNSNYGASGIKKTSFNTTIVTPTTSNLNSIEGQYQSAYADTINGLISEMLTQMQNGFQYDPTQDAALKMATEYAANSTLQSLAGSGVLNSSATAERVSRIVSELIPQYEEKAHNRWIEYLGQLADTAQIVMNYDSQQFEYWKDAKDREFQNKEFEYQIQQDALENAWKRVDELGYVDNNASAILGVPVGTLSGEARLAKEQREFELAKMREQAQIEYENNKALYKLRNELDIEQGKQLAEYEYTLANKYGSSKSNSEKTSLSTYQDIIETRWGTKDDFTGETTISKTNNDTIWNYIRGENEDGRMSDNTAYALIDKYGLENPGTTTVQKSGDVLFVKKGSQYYSLKITPNATRNQILNWGNNIGVDLSSYV